MDIRNKTPSGSADELRRTVTEAVGGLRSLSEESAAKRPAPGKWSPKQIVGHLIDSASNNHTRFVQAQLSEAMCFEGYDQDAWVAAQGYGDAPWTELVALWEGLNLHLARVIELVPEEARSKERVEHNLDRLAWETVPRSEPATLEYFMRDYVGHLKHHLRQIDPKLAPPPELQRSDGRPRSV